MSGEQLHINAYEVEMDEDEGTFDEEEGNEENSPEVVEEVEPDVESIVSLQNNDWEAHSSDDEDSLVMSFQYLHGGEDRYDDTDILIDTGSTVSMIRNKKMLINLTRSAKILRAYTNGGRRTQPR